MISEHRYDRDALDPAQHRRALLALADDFGARLRTSDQIATGVTLSVRCADASSTRRSRTLPEPTQHTVLLARTAYTSACSAPGSVASRCAAMPFDPTTGPPGNSPSTAATTGPSRSKPSPTGPWPASGTTCSTPQPRREPTSAYRRRRSRRLRMSAPKPNRTVSPMAR
ncbi:MULTISPECIES: DinB/UmuC family translesion DNA polymerase [unclassified Streptomyces]|uniref:DinB/UmuC family translesion DNA polymerase n=1 Tax=unclassified Streptomyces TaxID=2593676 RepID=UPI002E122C23|nr:hypothetical protein OG458_04230 [Streptomyces sp. NBC_01281]